MGVGRRVRQTDPERSAPGQDPETLQIAGVIRVSDRRHPEGYGQKYHVR